ncbi:MAG: hypothetical protein K6E50_07030 [Lachnospiraceae bacterium]|nr:hypothetical protein [Lachnospiraceae bacterium]
MFYSKRDQNITYINHFDGLLEVEGRGNLCREDADVDPEAKKNWADEYDTLSVTEGITGIGEGYLEAFPCISCLILSRSVVSVAATPELLEKMRERKVLIRGEYDTFAESFAKENRLDFLHSDIPVAEYDIEAAHEHDIVTLRFHRDGTADIHYNCFTPGSSAGSYGGGEYAKELPQDFYLGCTMEGFAGNISKHAREQILANDAIRRFLEAENRRHAKS